MKKLTMLAKWYSRGLKARWSSRNTVGYNARKRWERANDGKRNGRHSNRMEVR